MQTCAKRGTVFPARSYSEHGPCGAGLRDPGVIQHTEAMIYALQLVNRDPSLLPNVSLGFVILDDCLKPTTALAQASTRHCPFDWRDCETKQNPFRDTCGIFRVEMQLEL